MTKTGYGMELEFIMGTIRILEVGTILEMIGIEVDTIEVIEETLRTEKGDMMEVETGIETTEEYIVGIEETMDLGRGELTSRDKMKRESVIT